MPTAGCSRRRRRRCSCSSARRRAQSGRREKVVMHFERDLGDGYRLSLRTRETDEGMLRLIEKNLSRLRAWEPWALTDQTRETLGAFTQYQLEGFSRGTIVPTVVFRGDEMVGAASVALDRATRKAELGYWLDYEAEGKGIAFLACSALVEHLTEQGMRRVEIRTAASNERSCRLAERLGFEREGVVERALVLGEKRLDLAIYSLAVDSLTSDSA
ncbi:N-acetyltransferase [Mycetocola zhujimingii]|uniref:N-acetyltransferase n=2 Tax=Mycetocola zhujimingii TaxID=2079792 RepID=A0A2U1TEC5_9MICO|nr:N-acetyltransferase [Mycetocola zhujimingii]